MLAVFPQFIRPDGWPVWLQALLLGALLLAIAIPIYSGLALAAAHMGRGLIAKPGATVWLNRMARSEEHTSELQSLMRISYAVFCLKKKNKKTRHTSL